MKRTDHHDQPMPTPNTGPAIVDLVLADVRWRGRVSQPPGDVSSEQVAALSQDSLGIAYRAAIDLAIYLRQCLAEREADDVMRKHGPAAARMCIDLSLAADHDVLVDQSRIRVGYQHEAQQLAGREYDAVECKNGDWRAAWAEAGKRLRERVAELGGVP